MTLRLERASVIRAGTAILNDATLACQAGRFTALCGPNGAGKTTSIAKLSNLLKNSGRGVILAAADTFRAAAIEQLQTWGQRIDIP
ncbi:MAG: ATP-binding cassette domain-containing protein, partial [Pseudomonadota bacterium]